MGKLIKFLSLGKYRPVRRPGSSCLSQAEDQPTAWWFAERLARVSRSRGVFRALIQSACDRRLRPSCESRGGCHRRFQLGGPRCQFGYRGPHLFFSGNFASRCVSHRVPVIAWLPRLNGGPKANRLFWPRRGPPHVLLFCRVVCWINAGKRGVLLKIRERMSVQRNSIGTWAPAVPCRLCYPPVTSHRGQNSFFSIARFELPGVLCVATRKFCVTKSFDRNQHGQKSGSAEHVTLPAARL